ncbi:hypothetical protein Q8W71_31065 [Methylobacterium sp. NEAU 140]|uniref:hypothetical protein n=1 Tax=Methylobacterium sp. NEAU 140 TaxID=3064945 RepID=UPI002736D720|nr:hypothetical protein [Methylobacterium sp. NEAU 140]MDP4027033.1 hypothetical protein [Methylobacterium sp. NEAU 140]
MSVEGIRADLEKRWSDQRAGKLCQIIIDYMVKKPVDQLQFMTYGTFAEILGKSSIDDETVLAITILTNSNISALDACAMFVDENDVEHEIDPSELYEALSTGKLVHPETGNPVEDFASKIIPFYVPSDRFMSNLR